MHTAYRVVEECASLASVYDLIDRVRDQTVADRFRATVRNHRRDRFLMTRRNVVTEPELRFFLGVLLNASRRQDVLTLTSQRNPKSDPVLQVAAWLRQLSQVTVKLQAEGVPWQPNLLGLPDIDDDVEHACVTFLRGETDHSNERAAKIFAQLRTVPALACLFDD
jgi:hypothetical protein